MTHHPINMHTYLRLSDVALRCGFDVDALLAHAGLHADTQHRRSERLPLKTVARLFEYGSQHGVERPFFLALAECFSFDFFPEVETFLATSNHLKEASKLLHWLPELLLDELRFTLGSPVDCPHMEVALQGEHLKDLGIPDLLNSIEDSVICCMLLFLKKLRLPLQGVTLHFRHSTQADLVRFAAEHKLLVRFDQAFSGLSGPADLWLHPIARQANPIHSQTEIIIEDAVQRLQRRRGISDCIRRELEKTPMTPLHDIADSLELSLRSVQRQLQAEGSSFQSLQNEVLLGMAQQHLKNTRLDMESIAVKLGFSDRHSFTRAFKRWTGNTPSEFRKQQGRTDQCHTDSNA